MSINLFPLMVVPPTVVGLVGLYRFWLAVDRLGLRRELMWHDGSRVQNHLALAVMGAGIIGFALYSVALPLFSTDAVMPYNLAIVAGFALWGWLCKQAQVEVAWFRVREWAFRAVASARLISAAELAHALKVSEEYEAAQRSGRPYHLDENRVIDVTPEIQK